MLTRRARSFLGGGIVAAIVAASALGADAQPTSNDKVVAEALFDEGKQQMERGNFHEACRAFEGSQKLDAGVGTLLYLGDCYERIDRLASAWATFREAAALARTNADEKREKIARDRGAALEPRLFKLTLAVVEPVPGTVVKRNGTALADATWGVPVPVDPGPQVIEASAPGFATFTKTIEVPKGPGSQTVAVPKLEKLPDAPPTATVTATATVAPTAPPPPEAPPPEPRSPALLVAGLVVGGIGVLGFAATGALAGVATSKYGEGDEFCEGSICRDQRGVDAAEDGRALGDAATGTLVASSVLAATGLTLVIVHVATEPSPPDASVKVGVAPHPQGAHAAIWGRFW